MPTPPGAGGTSRAVDPPASAPAPAGADSPSTDAAIVCTGITHVYGDGTRANDDINLSIRRGELFCLLGPNGAGKTTLIRQITTELRPTAGRITVLGADAHADPVATKRRMGIIPQAAGLFDGLTVEQHILHFGPLKYLTRAQTKTAAEQVIAECELEDLRRKKVVRLSGGQQRKLLVALALLADPDMLILDEPTVGLDPVARRTLWATIQKQRAAGKTILLTTHYMDEAEALADRIGFIERGRLTRVGTLQELYAQMGQSVRLTRLHPETGTTVEQFYFDTLPEAQAHVRQAGFEAYSVGRVSLEDIYLRLMGHAIENEAS